VARRAGSQADGWIPWQITAADFAARATGARAAHAASGRGGAFAVVAPLPARRVDDPDALRREIDAWRDAGATAFHVGFDHRGADDLIDLLERFAHAVFPAANRLVQPPPPR